MNRHGGDGTIRERRSKTKQLALITLICGLALTGCGQQETHQTTTSNTTAKAATASLHENNTAAADNSASNSPYYGPGKVQKVTIHSKALHNDDMLLYVYTPPEYDKSKHYPVLYMMHPLTGGAGTWFNEMKLNVTADRLIDNGEIEPLIIVSPEMDNSFGIDSSKKPKDEPDTSDPSLTWNEGMYETYFIKEVVPYIDAHYATIPKASSRYIGGASMGGFISLHDAFLHPDLFGKVSGDSPAISVKGGVAHFPFSDPMTRDKWAPAELAGTQDLHGMKVYLDCGKQDEYSFYLPVEEMYKTLKSRGVDVQMKLSDGNHSLTYWMNHEEDYLKFFAGIHQK